MEQLTFLDEPITEFYQIAGDKVSFGLTVTNGRIDGKYTAPLAKWAAGIPKEKALGWYRKQGFTITRLPLPTTLPPSPSPPAQEDA